MSIQKAYKRLGRAIACSAFAAIYFNKPDADSAVLWLHHAPLARMILAELGIEQGSDELQRAIEAVRCKEVRVVLKRWATD